MPRYAVYGFSQRICLTNVCATRNPRLLSDNLLAREVVEGASEAVIVEDYPDYPKGSCVLVLQMDREQQPVHVVWGIPKGHSSPAVLITAYRPDPEIWEDDYLRRRK